MSEFKVTTECSKEAPTYTSTRCNPDLPRADVGILCFEFEVFNFLFSNFSFKRLVLSYLTLVSLIPRSGEGLFNIASETRETYLATMN